MQAVLLIGLQGSGKSTFYERNFAGTHIRISLDIAGTRPREQRLLEACIGQGKDFVIDNTNATAEHRSRYIIPARAAGYTIVGYFFPPDVQACLARNAAREGKARIPPPGIYSTAKRFQPPLYSEGFDQLFEVKVTPDNSFEVSFTSSPQTKSPDQ
jgi:predicted kinase